MVRVGRGEKSEEVDWEGFLGKGRVLIEVEECFSREMFIWWVFRRV